MTKKELLSKKREYKHAMKLTRPLIGYLGNQYLYWERKYNDVCEQLKNKVK